MFWEVHLPEDVPGKVFIYKMPGHVGYEESFEEDAALVEAQGIDRVVCLAPLDEMRRKSPEYARAVEAGTLTWARTPYPIEDFRAPEPAQRPALLALVREIADDLRSGQRILIHCSAGKGRSGTVATCVLLALGLDEQSALQRVRAAGGRPETESQFELIDWVSSNVRPPSG